MAVLLTTYIRSDTKQKKAKGCKAISWPNANAICSVSTCEDNKDRPQLNQSQAGQTAGAG